jgi:Glycosyl transferase family 2
MTLDPLTGTTGDRLRGLDHQRDLGASAPAVVPSPVAVLDGEPGTLAISVVVPTCGRRTAVVAVVEALLAQDVPGSEVVVVDDGSPDGTVEALEALRARDERVVVLRQAHAGKRAANALALGRARGRVVLLLDDDVVPGPGLLAGHLRAHAGRDDLVVVGHMPTLVPARPTGADFATVLYAQEYLGRVAVYEEDPADVLQHLWMGNASLTRAGCRRAGLTELADFGFRHEDRDLGLGCRAAGLVGVFDRSLAAQHHHARTVEQFVRDCVQQGAGRAVLGRRHAGIEPLDLDELLLGLPLALAALVRATRREAVRRPVTTVLAAALHACVRLDDPRPALALARLLRRVEHQHGAPTQLRGGAGHPGT